MIAARGFRGWLAALLLAAATVGAAPAPAPSAAPQTPPKRIASLNLTADEVLVEILPVERLVAVTAAADDEGTSNIVGRVPPGVARFRKADLERLVALAPDLVVVSEYTDPDFLYLLERSGLRYHRMEGLRSLAGNREAILRLGEAVGATAGAEKLVARYDAVLADLAGRLRGVARPRVMYWASGMTAGGDTAIGALIESAGARNVARRSASRGSGRWARSARSWPIPTSFSSACGRARARASSSIPSSRGCARCGRGTSWRCRPSSSSP